MITPCGIVVVDDRITGGWYVTCDPRKRPTFVTAHLRGVDGPELLTQDGWDVDARLHKGRDAFGGAVVSAAAMVKTPVYGSCCPKSGKKPY